MAQTLTILYFAWVREKVGRDEDQLDLPDSVRSIGDLLAHLCASDGRYAQAFADTEKLRFALDQDFVGTDHALNGAKELAIFPPVTGG